MSWSSMEQDEPIIALKLALPSNLLSPNARVNRHKKAAITKSARRTAMLIARSSMNGGGYPLKHAVARETFVWPDKRRRDVRNAEASTKAVWDGIVDSGLIFDDDYWHLTHLPSQFDLNKHDPHLLIEIWESDP